MVIEDDIVRVRIVDQDWQIVSHFGKTAVRGGKSQIRTDPNERKQNISLDNLRGQLGELALCKYWTGSNRDYVLGRHMQDRYPDTGDCGEDIMGLNIDVKTSNRSNLSMSELNYRLAIRSKEEHPNNVYVLALIDPWEEGSRPDHVALIGWAHMKHFPKEANGTGQFDGAKVIKGRELNPIMPVKWAWLSTVTTNQTPK